MKLSTAYMQSEEFKARQGSFSFFCAQAVEFLKQFKADCVTGWKKTFGKILPKFENVTLALPFGTLSHREWQERAQQVGLKLVMG